ncbi:DUF5677 domain-containing protein [Catenulispora rubra]|uniref:DUF5677 domain-containing protein n=1 Tax=Catenulispora rubra TaxID=280293 RepID=UPI0018920EAE|nr:DUF5677 domain-containing protein [Catenulispora rubra]
MDDQPQPDVASDDEDAPRGVLNGIMHDAAIAGIEQGMSMEDAVSAATEALMNALPGLVDTTSASLHQGKPGLVSYLNEERAKLVDVIETQWGSALITYEAAAYVSYELGASIRQAYNEDKDSGDTAAEVGFLLHGRACTVAGEVLCLMRNGYSDGAIARQRTLHEIAVVMSVIMDNPGLDLAERYLDYSFVEQWKDMEEYQQHAEALGRAPFSDSEVAALKQQYDGVLTRWGAQFHKRHQWAAPLFANSKSIEFGQLEDLAGLGHLKPFYRLSNHYVHAGPRSAVLNLYNVRGRRSIGAGARADTDIGEVGHGALTSLLQCTVPLIARDGVVSNDPDTLLAIKCMQRLVDDAGTAFQRSALRR